MPYSTATQYAKILYDTHLANLPRLMIFRKRSARRAAIVTALKLAAENNDNNMGLWYRYVVEYIKRGY